jgi:integrase
MRRRWARGSIQRVGKSWVGQYRDEKGQRRNKVLGDVSQMGKREAGDALYDIVKSLRVHQDSCTFGDFVRGVYLPHYRRKWKVSTISTNEDRLRRHLLSEFGRCPVDSLTRDLLEDFLERQASAGLSFSTVDHLRWDLRQIFGLAVEDGLLKGNPAGSLFTPKTARRNPKPVMEGHHVQLLLSALGMRELIVIRLVLFEGLRPGEVLALQWGDIGPDRISISRRVYRGKLDSPKSHRRSEVPAAVSSGTRQLLDQWKLISPDTSCEGWIFPSENLRTPISRDNLWRRDIAPILKSLGLGWVNFHVLRRTSQTLQHRLKTDPKVVSDQLGHGLGVGLNEYTQTSVEDRSKALAVFENFLADAESVTKVSQAI